MHQQQQLGVLKEGGWVWGSSSRPCLYCSFYGGLCTADAAGERVKLKLCSEVEALGSKRGCLGLTAAAGPLAVSSSSSSELWAVRGGVSH